jgi:preprotein translocase subunit SecF
MDVIGKRLWFFLGSGAIILAGIISLMIPPALRAGIDFTGGSAMTLTFSRAISESEVRSVLTDMGHPEAIIQILGKDSVFIRTTTLKEAELGLDDSVETPAEHVQIEEALRDNVASIEAEEFDSVSPVVARETVRNAGIAVAIAAVAILVYITWAFRRVPKPFRYGVCAVVALVHDLLVVLGVFSILGKTMNMEVNSMFIVGVLTLLGYSVNDTIVVFDRIRENISRAIERPLREVVNESLWQTLGRSLNTSLTTLVVLVALYLLGGSTIRPLVLVFIIGIVTGTYSSIFVASQLLVSWEIGDFGRVLRFLHLAPARSS